MHNTSTIVFTAFITLVLGLIVGNAYGGSAAKLQPQPQMQMSGMSGMHGAMNGMMMGMEGKTGSARDEAFLDEMIVHHQGAVEMANSLLETTKRPELTKMAHDIISAQSGEIEMMKKWRNDWFGK